MWVALAKAMAVAVAALTVALFTACGGGDAARFTQVSAGDNHTCGLRSDGSVVCWGSEEYGQLRVPADERFTAIAAGGIHTCGLRSNETTFCWGNSSGLSEDEAILASAEGWYDSPFPPEDARFTAIAAGGGYTCGFRTDGGVICWDIRSDFSPFGAEQIVEISAGGSRLCGLRSDGSALCWGFGGAAPEGERFVAISTAFAHICGLHSDGSVLCWGSDIASQLSPPEDGPFSAIAAGSLHTCALRSDGSAVCWGYDFERLVEGWKGPIGEPIRAEVARMLSVPRVPLPEGGRFTAITAGYAHACGLRQDGGVSCWGYNHHGQASPLGVSG